MIYAVLPAGMQKQQTGDDWRRKKRNEHSMDFIFMLSGALLTAIIIVSSEGIDLSIVRFALYSVAGCLAGYGLREVALRARQNGRVDYEQLFS